MVVGDGAIVRAGLNVVLDGLHKIAAPTGARGSVLLMTGGLIVLGFLFLAFLFRSAIVGDLAPVANARAPARRLLDPRASAPARVHGARGFADGRALGRECEPALDEALSGLRAHGADARILRTRAGWKIVSCYHCATCSADASSEGCEFERGYLAGMFERLTGDLAKVHEVACTSRGDPHCAFEVRHAPIAGVE